MLPVHEWCPDCGEFARDCEGCGGDPEYHCHKSAEFLCGACRDKKPKKQAKAMHRVMRD